MLVEEKLGKEMPIKVANNWKTNYQNRDKEDNGFISKEACALDCYVEYTPIGTTYTKALEHLLSKPRSASYKLNLRQLAHRSPTTRA